MKRRWGARALAGCVLAAAGLSCLPSQKGAEPREGAPEKPRVVIRTASREIEVAVELARTEQERARGLMFRDRLGPDQGMLFVFPTDEPHDFWMKNTLIPLDMIFIDGLGNVVDIVAQAQPLTETLRHGGPSRYVLEVAGGWADDRGVKVGDRVLFRGPVTRPRYPP